MKVLFVHHNNKDFPEYKVDFFLFFLPLGRSLSAFSEKIFRRKRILRIFVWYPLPRIGTSNLLGIMKKVVYIGAVVVVLAAAIGWAVRYNARACNYEYQVVSRTDENCKDSSDCTSFYLSYPVFAKKLFSSVAVDSINASVYRQMAGPEAKTTEQLADEFFEGYKSYIADRLEIAREESDSTMAGFIPGWYYNAECFVVVNGPKLIVTGLKFSQFEGGAHGLYGMSYSNYDMATGRMLTLDDVFSDTLALDKKMTELFIGQKELDANIPLSEQGYFIDNNLLPLTQNFALTPEGVVFYYNVYEIAPYSDGPSCVKVPYEELSDILKFKPDFEGAEVFSSDLDA